MAARRWVVKVGSALLTNDGCGLDASVVQSLANQLVALRKTGCDVVLVSSGAIAAGLGIRFLKHLTRNRVLLHLVDVAPIDVGDPPEAACAVIRELEAFSPTLAQRPRWLILNKTDLVDEATLSQSRDRIVEAIGWSGPVYSVSAVAGRGTELLCGDLMTFLEGQQVLFRDDPEAANKERFEQ